MNQKTKHTPGPLKAVQIIVENSPCTWAVQRKNIREQWGKPSVATYIDNEADAKLFAAAPEMLKCLKWALTGLQYLAPDRFDEEEHEAEWNRRLAEMDATITKAEGGA